MKKICFMLMFMMSLYSAENPLYTNEMVRLSTFNDNYFLPVVYSTNGQANTTLPVGSEFQLGLKARLYQENPESFGLYFAYTQKSVWDMYNRKASYPIYTTDYQFDVFTTLPYDINTGFGTAFKELRVGYNHQSNGEGFDPDVFFGNGNLGKSWNRIYALTGFSLHENVYMEASLWADLGSSLSIDRYAGVSSLKLYYIDDKHRLTGFGTNNLRFNSQNKSTFKATYSYEIIKGIGLYAKYYVGYADTLLSYNKYSQKIGVGISFR